MNIYIRLIILILLVYSIIYDYKCYKNKGYVGPFSPIMLFISLAFSTVPSSILIIMAIPIIIYQIIINSSNHRIYSFVENHIVFSLYVIPIIICALSFWASYYIYFIYLFNDARYTIYALVPLANLLFFVITASILSCVIYSMSYIKIVVDKIKYGVTWEEAYNAFEQPNPILYFIPVYLTIAAV